MRLWHLSIRRLCFPPPSGPVGPAGLCPLPSYEFGLHAVVSLGVFVGLAVGVGGVGVDAGVDGSGYAEVRLRHWFRCFPTLEADVPAAVLSLDVDLVIDAFGKGAVEFHRAQSGQLDLAFAVVFDLGCAAGGAKGSGPCDLPLAEPGCSGLQVRVSPVGQGFAEVHEGTFGDAGCDFGRERVVLALAGIELLVDVLPGGPWEAVIAAEAVGGDGEVVAEPVYSDGAAAVLLLLLG